MLGNEICSTLRASLNYPTERRSDFVFSNYRPEWRTLEVTPHEVDIHDARELAHAPQITREGFELHRFPVANPQWTDDAWIQEQYAPALRELVLARTGGVEALTFLRSWVLRDTNNVEAASAALYVHMDRERENCRAIVRNHLGAEILKKHKRFEQVNIWRSITPPPQDYPLAYCDQRTIDASDFITCQTLEPNLIEEMKHTVSLYNPEHKWYYFSNMQLDEISLFRNYNDDPQGIQGCLHSAFHNKSVADPIPRASFEIRFYVFHDE